MAFVVWVKITIEGNSEDDILEKLNSIWIVEDIYYINWEQ